MSIHTAQFNPSSIVFNYCKEDEKLSLIHEPGKFNHKTMKCTITAASLDAQIIQTHIHTCAFIQFPPFLWLLGGKKTEDVNTGCTFSLNGQIKHLLSGIMFLTNREKAAVDVVQTHTHRKKSSSVCGTCSCSRPWLCSCSSSRLLD